jgi:hypothetical protein
VARFSQRVAERGNDQAAGDARFAEAHFGLGGVDVHVDTLGIDGQEQDGGGVTVARQNVLIGGAE